MLIVADSCLIKLHFGIRSNVWIKVRSFPKMAFFPLYFCLSTTCNLAKKSTFPIWYSSEVVKTMEVPHSGNEFICRNLCNPAGKVPKCSVQKGFLFGISEVWSIQRSSNRRLVTQVRHFKKSETLFMTLYFRINPFWLKHVRLWFIESYKASKTSWNLLFPQIFSRAECVESVASPQLWSDSSSRIALVS